VKRSEVLAIRREVNRQRKAGRTEAQIAQRLRALRLAAPSGKAWQAAGVASPWTAHSVTRFMETTSHVKAPAPKPKPVAAKAAPPQPSPTVSLHVKGVRGPMIYTSAPDPALVVRFPV
jgi:hypothetical protein